MRTILLTGSFVVVAAAFGQVAVDRPVQLIGTDPSMRQVLGLDTAQQPGHALDAATDGSGAHRWAGDAAGAAWSVGLGSLNGPPTAGTSVIVRTQSQQSGAVTLELNGTGAYPVVLGPGLPLQGDELPNGTLVSLVFDGSQFQVTNGVAHGKRDCPAGMVAVSEHYCIDTAEGPVGTFYDAAVACVQAGARLCSWSEWQQACWVRNQIGLVAMIGNWEWTNNSANEDQGVRVVGNTSCTVAGVTFGTAASGYSRCCYTR